MKPIERLALYFKQCNIKFSLVEKSIGIANGYLGKQVKNQSSIGSDILEKICKAYPKLNPTWLLTGNGPQQILEDGTTKNNDAGSNETSLQPIPGTIQKEIELYKLQIESLTTQVDFLRREIKMQNEIIVLLRASNNGQ